MDFVGMLSHLFRIAIVAILVNNFIFAKFLGICPFLGVSKKTDTAIGMGLAVIFVMTVASAATWAIQEYILNPLHAIYLQTIAFILVIAVLVQFVEMVLQKLSPALYSALGIYLPLITTNCAVLGVAIINIQNEFSFLESLAYGCFSGVGFTLAIVLFAGVRERLEDADIPEFMQGVPIALVAAGLMAIAFMGFQNLATL